MGKIVLVNPLSMGGMLNGKESISVARKLIPPLGLVYLASALRKKFSHEQIVTLDFNSHREHFFALRTKDDIYHSIRDVLLNYPSLPPQNHWGDNRSVELVFCISVSFTAMHLFFSQLSAVIRELYPSSIICCGGAHASSIVEYLVQESGEADYVLCGEGEVVFPELMDRLLSGRSPDNLPGVHSKGCIRRDSFGNIEHAPLAKNIDLDFTEYDRCLDMKEYVSDTSLLLSFNKAKARSFTMMASRGCPGTCSFCSISIFHGARPRWRSSENIRDEIVWLREKHGVRRIMFTDANFVPKGKILELLKNLHEFSELGMEFSLANMSVYHTDTEIIDAMVDANMTTISLAVESGVEKTLKGIGKRVDLKKVRELCDYAHSNNMLTKGFFIIGFPDETLDEMHQTIDFAYSLNMDWITVSVATPLPGTRMFDQFVESGYITNSAPYWEEALFAKRNFDTSEIKAEVITDLAFRAVLKNNYINSRLIREGRYAEAELLFVNVTDTIKTQIFGFDALRRIYALSKEREKETAVISHMIDLMQTNRAAREYHKYLDLMDLDMQKMLTGIIRMSV